MFFFFFVPPKIKRTKKKKARSAYVAYCHMHAYYGEVGSLKTIRALRFSLPAGLSELGLWLSPQTCRQAYSAINCDAL